jgi:CRISPR-associated protein Csm1
LGLELGKKKNLKSFENLEYILNDFVNADLIRKREQENLAMEIQIGKQLPKLKYLCMVSSCKNPKSLNDSEIAFPEFDFSIHLCKNVSDVETLVSRNSGADIKVLSVNNTEYLQEFDRGIFDQVSKGFRFIGNYVPMDSSNNPLTFEEIAKINSANYPLLGILRMDVDNLGAIFSFGLKAENDKERKYTPSRVACLSRSLNNFFTGRINHLAKKHSIYLAYSGGDDVFAVGSWINILHFSLDLREEFDRFACLNQNLSISAGVVFTKPNFPISESANLAGEQEHLAKKTNPAIVKNRVSIFDIQMTWEEFMDYSSWAEELSEALLSEEDKDTKLKIPRSFIHSLLSLTKKSFSEDGKINIREFKRSSTKILYQFARRNFTNNLLESEQTGDLNKYLTSLALKFLKSENKQDFQRKFQFPASIILFKTRR